MEKYTKPSLTYVQQVDLLKKRGLIIGDPAAAERCLKQISYYRLSAYCLPFEVVRHQFKPGVTFEQIIRLYEFDRRLRFLIDEALEVIEISVRAITSHEMAQKYGPFFHEEPKNFFVKFDHAAWVEKVHDEARRSREIFIAHYKRKYDGFPRLPIWVAVEIMSFGSISLMIDHLKREDQLILARQFGLHTSLLMSWLHTFAYVRNICAHHARLWDRKLAIAMVAPKEPRWNDVDPTRLGSVVLAINQFLYRLPIDGEILSGWRKEIVDLFEKTPEVDGLWTSMGLPRRIQEHRLWQEKAPVI
ncbi:MAG: Abi family protein [Candidatus Omnitrophica bacterium]|nr:Abi family protein [Candidatus Omnitrophota bacterium]